MDLVELQKPAILFPTPNQSEQLYLADYLLDKNYFVIGKESQHLADLAKQTNNTTGFLAPSRTLEAIQTIYQTLPH